MFGIRALALTLIWYLGGRAGRGLLRLPWVRSWADGAYTVYGEGVSAEDILVGVDQKIEDVLNRSYPCG